MKNKKWIDCPLCGAKGTMEHRKNLSTRYNNKNYGIITIDKLDGQFCSECNDGFFSIKSTKKINSILTNVKIDEGGII